MMKKKTSIILVSLAAILIIFGVIFTVNKISKDKNGLRDLSLSHGSINHQSKLSSNQNAMQLRQILESP